MSPQRWQQIKNLVNSALEQEAEQRAAVLHQSCADDLPLRRGAEALLSFHEQATRNLANAPALGAFSAHVTLSPEQWERIEKLFQSAMELDPAKRAAFLGEVCGDDERVLHEVESLLVYQAAAGDLIGGAIQQAAGLLNNGAAEKARFTPGTTLNKRYRIIGLLGKGGMGEVYRADDLKLGQPVALKFLTEKLSNDKAMLARFHSEVAMAHRVTHPNVCRVHDIGEVTTSSGNLHFLSMEYVDGEDLSSLLRRIGRLPADKAVEIATQLCAGLAAAHEAGVLHRDLKPANVMLDGKGRVRITDFGLAGFAEQIRGEEVFAGTPAYMSPEQFAGKEVTTKSDIYALGLVLYEIFTGKRVFEAGSLDELRRLHESSSPTNPSNWVKDIDPLVERVTLRCLEKDPGKRLASAKQVADALPGGDPLAAALAMGDTPSPEMVAAAGQKTGMRPAYAVACLIAVIVGLIVFMFLGSKTDIEARVIRENSPDALAHKSRDIIERLGYTARPIDSAYEFGYLSAYLRYVEQKIMPAKRVEQLIHGKPSPVIFLYRESPRYLSATNYESGGWVSEKDPSMGVSGMVNLRLDMQGRLILFSAVPPQLDTPRDIPPSPDWMVLFAAAGLDSARFAPTESQWVPPTAFDTRAAWTETNPVQPENPLRIEAAAYRGKPVYFHLIWPWTVPERIREAEPTMLQRIGQVLFWCLGLSLLLGAVLLASHNYRQGRGDQRGAFRLAIFIFSVVMLRWLFGAHHVPTFAEVRSFLYLAVSPALLAGSIVWLIYIALEPYARRRWPVTLISWSRVLSGSLRDPLVGRDLLIGVVFNIGMALPDSIFVYIKVRHGIANLGGNLRTLLGVRYLIANGFLESLLVSILVAFFIFFLFFLLRILTRRQWLASCVFILIGVLPIAFGSASPLLDVLDSGLVLSLLVVILLRFGFLTLVTFWFVGYLTGVEATTDISVWYAGNILVLLLAVLALAVYAFHTSLGGQKVFAGKLLEE